MDEQNNIPCTFPDCGKIPTVLHFNSLKQHWCQEHADEMSQIEIASPEVIVELPEENT